MSAQSPKASQQGKTGNTYTAGHASFLDELKDKNVVKKLRHVQLEEVKSGDPNQESSSPVIKPSAYRNGSQFGGNSSPSGTSKWGSKSSSAASTAAEEKIITSVSTKPSPTPSNQVAPKPSFKTSSKVRRGLQGGGWEERFTVDGVPYYYNPSTDCLSWEKPECLRTEEEKREGSSRWVWIEDPEQAWIPVCVVSPNVVIPLNQPILTHSVGIGKRRENCRPHARRSFHEGSKCGRSPLGFSS